MGHLPENMESGREIGLEPLPCPICGSKVSYQTFNVQPSCAGRIICKCGLEIRHGKEESRDELIVRWNERSPKALMPALRRAQRRFECYMTASRWDGCCAEGIYEDDGVRAVSCFLEFVEDGKVTDDDGREL